ncbi:outer membrane autotransporter, putative, partial [Acidithiobacillus sp. GGI-221]
MGSIDAMVNAASGSISSLRNAGSGTLGIGAKTALNNAGSIATLSNSGAIHGTLNGVYNSGTIGTLNNQTTGQINEVFLYSGSVGQLNNVGSISTVGTIGLELYNLGTLGTLNNSGAISGGSEALVNQGIVTSLVNSGTIAANHTGLGNGGSIGAVSNTGTVGSGLAAVANSYGTIDSFQNASAGLLSGGHTGINNDGVVGTLTNAGAISGSITGIFNQALIGTLNNSGTINGASHYGFNDHGQLGSLINSGAITGKTGLSLAGASTTVTNTGTIIGTGGTAIKIANGNPDTLILSTGSDVQGTIDAGTTASTILLEGDPVMGTSTPINDPNGSLTIQKTGNWTVNDTWSVGTVTNDGMLTIASVSGTTTAPGLLNLTGNYVQSSTGTLAML